MYEANNAYTAKTEQREPLHSKLQQQQLLPQQQQLSAAAAVYILMQKGSNVCSVNVSMVYIHSHISVVYSPLLLQQAAAAAAATP